MSLNNDILVSVVVPLYNYQSFIGDCIQSILNQTYYNLELIVVDDRSIDKSYKVAKKFEDKDSRVKVIRLDRNRGYSTAKNEAIVRSSGEYIITLDADDMMTTTSVEDRLKATIDYCVPFVYADAIKIVGNISLQKCYGLDHDNVKKVVRIPPNKPKFIYDPSNGIHNIHAQTVMIHREVFKQYGLFDENLRSRSDREMWWRLFGKDDSEKPKIDSYYLNSPVAYYRSHYNSMWKKRKRDPVLDQKVINMSEDAYNRRKKDGINRKNTRFLEK